MPCCFCDTAPDLCQGYNNTVDEYESDDDSYYSDDEESQSQTKEPDLSTLKTEGDESV